MRHKNWRFQYYKHDNPDLIGLPFPYTRLAMIPAEKPTVDKADDDHNTQNVLDQKL